jgi:hypothetical protein
LEVDVKHFSRLAGTQAVRLAERSTVPVDARGVGLVWDGGRLERRHKSRAFLGGDRIVGAIRRFDP